MNTSDIKILHLNVSGREYKIKKSILKNPTDGSAWETAQNLVKNYVKKKGTDNTKGAEFYHTTSIKPSWDYSKLKYTTTIGNHKFYKPIA